MIIKEGKCCFHVPGRSLTRKSEAFYNPVMEYQRDITISALRSFSGKSRGRMRILDPMAATGVRGIRIAKEVPRVGKVLFNDLNPDAVRLIRKNIKKNKVPAYKFSIKKADALSLFLERRSSYDFVDIDPFGSPIRYLKNVGHCLKPRSLLAVTATDAGALSGAYPEACMRRYGVRTFRTDFPKEIGVRVLVTSIMKELSPYDLAFEPLYSHGNHYFRAIGRIERSTGKADSCMKKMGYISYCRNCLARTEGIRIKCSCGSEMNLIGPLWLGKTHDRPFCRRMLSEFDRQGFSGRKELFVATGEADSPYYYDIHSLSRIMRSSSPKMETLIAKLQKKGYKVSRTRFSDRGLRVTM